MKLDTWDAHKFSQHIRVLGVKSADEWERLCPASFQAALKRGTKFYREVTQGIIAQPWVRRLAPEKQRGDDTVDYCVEHRIRTCDELRQISPERYARLGVCKYYPEYWQAVRILLGEEQLPDDFDPLNTRMHLSAEHLRYLGYFKRIGHE